MRNLYAETESDIVLITDLILAIARGFEYDPGIADLDDEQPIRVKMTLGDYRKACQILRVSPHSKAIQ